MPKVTGLKAQKRRRDRANVYLDGEYAFSLQKILAVRLVVGQELSDQEIAALRAEDEAERAYERTLNYLSYRPRSKDEIQRYLEGKKVAEEVISQVIARLQRAKLIDDRAFADFWVENRETFRPRGAWALRAELRQKGIASEIIESALDELDEKASALKAGERGARRYANLDRETFFRRMLGYLQRRGFGYGIARQVVDHYWEQVQNHQEPESGL